MTLRPVQRGGVGEAGPAPTATEAPAGAGPAMPAPATATRHMERVWLLAALLFALLFSARAMAPAFGPGETIQDDARQHVFWMLRFRDPELFRDDVIADYFQSVAPLGYTALYWAMSRVVDPLVASKLLPPVLGLATALFTFLFVRRLHPSPAAAFLATALLSWYIWQYDDLASASPRAFLLPLLAALLWALAAGRPALAVGLTAVTTLFYPPGGVLGVALLGARAAASSAYSLSLWERERVRATPVQGNLSGSGGALTPALSQRETELSRWLTFLAAAILVGAVLLPGQLIGSRFGPNVSGAEARTMPEFGPNGRTAFFSVRPYKYWLESYRSGFNLLVHDRVFRRIPIFFEYTVLAAVLPVLLLSRRRLPAARRLTGEAVNLLHLLVASCGLFVLAHLLLFRLYLPARYVQWSVPLVLAVAAGLGLGILVEEVARRLAPGRRQAAAAGLAGALAVGVAAYPAEYYGNFVRDRHPAITAYLRTQPKDTLVVGAPTEADSVPALAGRQVLVSREYALPYQLGYYGEMRRRTEDVIEAYYSGASRRVVQFAERYGVDLFLVNREAFDRSGYAEAWAYEFEPFTSSIQGEIRRRDRFALLDAMRRCAVVDDGVVAIVTTDCVREGQGEPTVRVQEREVPFRGEQEDPATPRP